MIFITGATGLVGARIMYDLLLSGEKIKALHRPSSDLDFTKKMMDFHHGSDSASLMAGLEWVQGDLNDEVFLFEALIGCNEVYHAGALVSFHSRDKNLMYQTNVKGTSNLVNAALANNVSRFCHISSVASLGRTVSSELITEESQWMDSEENSQYAITKYLAEMEVWRAAEEGLQVTIVNPVLVLGPSDPRDSSAQLFMTAQKGLSYYTDGTSSLVDVRDVSMMSILLMKQGGESERFILSAETVPSRKFYSLMAKAFGNTPPSKKVSRRMIHLAWRILWLKDLILGTKSTLTKETARSIFTTHQYSSAKVKKRLSKEFISVEESVQAFAPFYLGQEAP